METRILKNTNLTVSRICLGSMTFGKQVAEPDAAAMLDVALDSGINFIDTANAYHAGRSESILGNLLQGRREKVILSTKVFNKMGEETDQRGLSHAAILRAVEDSLRRLRSEYIDIYYLHAPDYNVPLEETMAAMDQLVRQGKIRYVGESNYASWQLARTLWIADQAGLAPVRVSQPMYNLIARGIEQEQLPACKEFNVSTVVYNPLAGGLLTGKQTMEKPISGTRFDGNQQYLNRYWHSANFDAVRALHEIGKAADRSLVSLALNWLLHHSQAECVIIGASKMEHLTFNLGTIAEGPLPKEAVAGCDQVWSKLRGTTPQYNR